MAARQQPNREQSASLDGREEGGWRERERERERRRMGVSTAAANMTIPSCIRVGKEREEEGERGGGVLSTTGTKKGGDPTN
jgi:hypothetical protein